MATVKKIGRPKKDLVRPNWIGVRLSDAEKEDLDHLSKILGMSKSDTIRYAINKTYVDEDQNQWRYV